ncbi:MAG: hypothetical protein HY059_14855 [Proteobacteria bacterium]|nr:hypothetical protein [Pseudomonadota bacterium]
MHHAVCVSGGLDTYTGEALDWHLMSTFNNDEAKRLGREYKHRFSMLPTVDHVSNRRDKAAFVICSWKVNDAKSDLSYEEFLELCRKILDHADRNIRLKI